MSMDLSRGEDPTDCVRVGERPSSDFDTTEFKFNFELSLIRQIKLFFFEERGS